MAEFLILTLVLALLVFPIWALVRIIALGRENNAVAQRLQELSTELMLLRDTIRRDHATGATPASSHSASPAHDAPTTAVPAPAQAVPPMAPRAAAPLPTPPPVAATPPPAPVAPVVATRVPAAPTPLRPAVAAVPPVVSAPRARERMNWEQFTGAKLFAWIGGFAAFLAAAFFVKYSFEHDLIPPEVRVAIGFLFAVGLVIGGLKVPRPRHTITSDSLIATGIVSLYAVTFACNSVYHFAWFGPIASFAMMVLITTAAFLLAVRLDARVVAVLGLLGGFLTPLLLSTGHDNPPGLFGYLALLDVGLIAVALHRRWNFLVPLGAAGTILMEIGWAIRFFAPEKVMVAMIVTLGFSALFLAAYLIARRREQRAPEITICGIALAFTALGFAFAFLIHPTITARPGLLLTYAFIADLVLLAIAWLDDEARQLHLVAGLTAFALLAAWTNIALTSGLLDWALAYYLVFAVLHTAFPVVLQRFRATAAPTWWSQLFPPLTLILLLLPMFRLDALSLVFWPCVLAIDLLAIVLALFTGSVAAVAAVLLLTLGATGIWMYRLPAVVGAAPELLLIIGGFGVLFFAASWWLASRLKVDGAEPTGRTTPFGNSRAQLPAFSALLPFVLLIMMTTRLPLANPSPAFGLALLLVVLVLGLAFVLVLEWLPACALAGVAALEYAWHAQHFRPENAGSALGWYLVFLAAFAAYPFAGRKRFTALTGPWAVAAGASVVQFPLVYWLVKATWPNRFLGALPAMFAVVPLLSLVAVLQRPSEAPRARLNQLAWFGGVTLLFITLVFPLQFDRQWLTAGWALEGAALLWLYQRVPHEGVRATGAVLLVIAFVRLALNPAVLAYHPRSDTALLNWYPYTYGIAIAALFGGARLAAAPRNRALGVDLPPCLNTLGTVLAFLLLNIEIADYFSTPGTHVLTFQFSGNFARDMSYTIGWAVFALVLLLIGFWRQLRAGRYAALGLLGVAALKLFFHDLSRLDSLYRIGALVAIAVVATLASFAYQRFLPAHEKSPAREP
jgi:uncharacterized membrane protein